MKKRFDIEYEDNIDEDADEILKIKHVPSLFDDSVEIVGADDVQSPPSSAATTAKTLGERLGGRRTDEPNSVNLGKGSIQSGKNDKWEKKNHDLSGRLSDNTENSDEDDDEEDDDDDDDIRAPVIQGGYDPSDYDQLTVSEEIKDVFSYITKYTPQNIELENKLCPFLPEFIPAVGDLDAFVKVPRPDGQKDGLGLTVLDEPRLQQSDAAVLQLQLRAIDKQSTAKAVVVKKIENAEKNSKSIDRWIKAISDLHSKKPSQTVQYAKSMPNVDNLMQEWPQELEEKLNITSVPNPDLDCDLSTYVTIICNLFDIPVYDSKISSLHLFFSLYSTIKNTQEQLNQAPNNGKTVNMNGP